MVDVQLGDDPQFESRAIPRMIFKKPPFMVGLVLKIGFAKTPEQANLVLAITAAVFFVISAIVFIVAL